MKYVSNIFWIFFNDFDVLLVILLCIFVPASTTATMVLVLDLGLQMSFPYLWIKARRCNSPTKKYLIILTVFLDQYKEAGKFNEYKTDMTLALIDLTV